MATRGIDKGAWVRYDHVDFATADASSSGRGWMGLSNRNSSHSGRQTIRALELGDDWCPIPYWEGQPGLYPSRPEGAPTVLTSLSRRKEAATVKWSVVTEPLVSRATVKHPLGVINCDVVNGENHANGEAYMGRSSVYAKDGGTSESGNSRAPQ